MPVAAQAAATTGKTTFAISGALQGTLSTGNYGCSDIGGYGAQFEFFNTLNGLKATEWVVNVNNLGKQKHGGTFKKFGGLLGNGVSIVLEASTAKTSYWWATKSGTLTITPTSGHLHVLLVPDQSAVGKPGKGNVHLVGSWGCIASS